MAEKLNIIQSARQFGKTAMQIAMWEYLTKGGTQVFEVRSEDLDRHYFQKLYMNAEFPPPPWAEAGNDLARMVADGLTRAEIRKAFLAYYPAMTHKDVHVMLEKWERDHGEIKDNYRVRSGRAV